MSNYAHAMQITGDANEEAYNFYQDQLSEAKFYADEIDNKLSDDGYCDDDYEDNDGNKEEE
jgi:hypothetical protein